MTRTPGTVLSIEENWMLQVVFWQRRGAGSSPIIYKYTASPELSGNSQLFHPETCNPLSPTVSELKELSLLHHDGFLMTLLFLSLQCANFSL